jgi:hypothetical protein
MSALRTIPDSAADEAAKEQARMRADVVYDTASDAAEDLILKGKIPDPAKIMAEKLKDALAPTLVGDGQAAAGDVLAPKLQERFQHI